MEGWRAEAKVAEDLTCDQLKMTGRPRQAL